MFFPGSTSTFTFLVQTDDVKPTHTSESLCPVAVSDSNHQRKEVDFTESPSGPLHQTASAARGNSNAAQPPARKPTVTHKPLWPSLPTLQLVLTAALQSQSQTLITWGCRGRQLYIQECDEKVAYISLCQIRIMFFVYTVGPSWICRLFSWLSMLNQWWGHRSDWSFRVPEKRKSTYPLLLLSSLFVAFTFPFLLVFLLNQTAPFSRASFPLEVKWGLKKVSL